MGKSTDKGDSTLLVSESQILTAAPNPPASAVGKHDQSVWKGVVVSADEFAPAPAPRTSRAPRWVIFGVLGAGAVAAGGVYAFYPSSNAEPPPHASPPAAAAAVPVTPDAAPAPMVPAADAAPADVTPVDAATADAPPDAAPVAVPDAAVPPKPATKKPVIKKKVVLKKKPATSTKRRAR
jgi:hypothetical protein